MDVRSRAASPSGSRSSWLRRVAAYIPGDWVAEDDEREAVAVCRAAIATVEEEIRELSGIAGRVDVWAQVDGIARERLVFALAGHATPEAAGPCGVTVHAAALACC